jgi:UDP-glucose-4-epimerase GalE
MTILVTGGLGFIGSHFTWAAHAAGRKVVVIDDRSGGSSPPLPPGVEVVTADVGDRQVVADVCARFAPKAMVHFAGKIQVGESVTRPGFYFDMNLGRALTLIDVAQQNGIDQVVFSSSAAVYGEPKGVPIPETAATRPVNPYGASKLSFEYVLEGYGPAHGIRWAALRYFNAAGAAPDGSLRESHEPETHLIPLVIDAALGRRPPVRLFGTDYPTRDGTCVRDYIHVWDLVDAHLRALDLLADGKTVGALNLGTGAGVTVREILEAVREVMGVEVPHTVAARRPGDPAELVADPARAAALLGWRPSRSDIRTIVEDALRSRR